MADTALRLVEKDNMDKEKALDAALAQIDRAFGKGSVMKLGEQPTTSEEGVVSTGSLGLDIALGIGGLFQNDRKKVFSVLGTTFNSAIILGIIGLMVLGAVAG